MAEICGCVVETTWQERYDADVAELTAALEEARRELRASMNLLATAWSDRDAARAEVERLTARCEKWQQDWAQLRRDRDGWQRAAEDAKRGYERMRPVLEAAKALRALQRRDRFDRRSTVEDVHALAEEYKPVREAFEAAVDTYESQEGAE